MSTHSDKFGTDFQRHRPLVHTQQLVTFFFTADASCTRTAPVTRTKKKQIWPPKSLVGLISNLCEGVIGRCLLVGPHFSQQLLLSAQSYLATNVCTHSRAHQGNVRVQALMVNILFCWIELTRELHQIATMHCRHTTRKHVRPAR